MNAIKGYMIAGVTSVALGFGGIYYSCNGLHTLAKESPPIVGQYTSLENNISFFEDKIDRMRNNGLEKELESFDYVEQLADSTAVRDKISETDYIKDYLAERKKLGNIFLCSWIACMLGGVLSGQSFYLKIREKIGYPRPW